MYHYRCQGRTPNSKFTDLEDDQCDYKSTRETMRRSSELDLCRTSAVMSAEAVLNETENDLRTYHIVYQQLSQESVTKWQLKRSLRQLPRDDDRAKGPRSWPNDSKLRLNKRIFRSAQPMAPTGMFTQPLTELNAE